MSVKKLKSSYWNQEKATFYIFARFKTTGIYIPVIEKVHIDLNQSKGILFDRDPDLDGIPEEETKSELESQEVVSFTNINTYLLTFGMPTFLTNIKVGLYQMKIDLFVPNPLLCFKCQRFGHGQNTCKGCEACFRCGEEGHDGKSCQKIPSVEIERSTTCHPQNNVLSWKRNKIN